MAEGGVSMKYEIAQTDPEIPELLLQHLKVVLAAQVAAHSA